MAVYEKGESREIDQRDHGAKNELVTALVMSTLLETSFPFKHVRCNAAIIITPSPTTLACLVAVILN